MIYCVVLSVDLNPNARTKGNLTFDVFLLSHMKMYGAPKGTLAKKVFHAHQIRSHECVKASIW